MWAGARLTSAPAAQSRRRTGLCGIARGSPAIKKYVVKLSPEERKRLEALIHAGKSSTQTLTRARILLKADISEAGEGWSDSAISAALDTSVNNVARTRQLLVEEGFEATLSRKSNPNSARPRIFDGAAEAKLIALACSPAPQGFARWTLRLLEEKVVELNIVEKASDNTIGRTLKKTPLNRTASGNGGSRPKPIRASSPPWKTCWRPTTGRAI